MVVNFTSQQTLAFRNCARDVLRRGTDFIFEALEEKKDILQVISGSKKEEILLAIERVEELNWDTFLHAVRFFIAFMNLDLPVKPSKKVLPYLCTFWNRLKNGSDTATQLIRSSWFPLPHPSRTPMGYVCQRLIFLSIFQIMRLQSVFDVQPLDTLDGWRKRFNKNQGSFKEGIYSLSTDVIIPMIDDIRQSRSLFIRPGTFIRQERIASNVPTESPQLVCIEPLRRSRVTRRQPQETQSRDGKLFPSLKMDLRKTNTTPKKRPRKSSDPCPFVKRVLSCTSPLGVHSVNKEDGKKRRGICRRCGVSTSYFCLGCHLFFCPTATKREIPPSSKAHLQDRSLFYTAFIGKDTVRRQVNRALLTSPQSPHIKQVPKKEDVYTSFEASCFIIAHQHCLR